MNREMWIEQTKKKIRFMTDWIWNGINTSDVAQFLTNFNKDDIVGLSLLDMLIYYSAEQEENLIESLLQKLKHDLWINGLLGDRDSCSADLLKKMNSISSRICFVPVNDENDPSSSSYGLSSFYKKSPSLHRSVQFVEPRDIPLMMALKKDIFVFYDDIIGTGNQFDKFWSKIKHFGDFDTTIDIIATLNKNVRFYYLALGGCTKSINDLRQKYPQVTILVAESFSDNCSVLDQTNEYWELNPQNITEVTEFINNKKSEYSINSKFHKDLPVLFQHGRAPNTSLFLYWNDCGKRWKELYRR